MSTSSLRPVRFRPYKLLRTMLLCSLMVALLSGDVLLSDALLAAGPRSKATKSKGDKEKDKSDKGKDADSTQASADPPARSSTVRPTRTSTTTTKVASRTEPVLPKPAAIPADHPLQPVLKAIAQSRTAFKDVDDYSASLAKREVVNNKLISSKMELKLRQEPFSVYLKFINPNAGREVIYVAGENKGQFLVHETGFASLAGTLSFAPTSRQAMAESRYPITQIGMLNLLDTLKSQLETDARFPNADVKHVEHAKAAHVDCRMFEVTQATKRDAHRFYKTRIYFDHARNFPVRVEQYGWPAEAGGEPALQEEYTYSNIQTNCGLTGKDFDTSNDEYDF